MVEYSFEKIVTHVRKCGFVYQGSEIYGGLANTWDYGPLGSELKKNIKSAWWKKFIQECKYNVGIDSSILMNPKVWEVSGHLNNFTDPLMDCKSCNTRHRADKLIENHDSTVNPGGWSFAQMEEYISSHKITCPDCHKSNFTPIRDFQLMFKTSQGVVSDSKSDIYLRPETAQGIFVNYKNVQRTSRLKIPFGIGQIGKSFRNEITPGNFIFRTREFEQMELEFFCKAETADDWFNYWKKYCLNFLHSLGVSAEKLRMRDHDKEELAHYSAGTSDIEYKFPFGWGELWGIANRTDYDLKQHMEHSKEQLDYFDAELNQKYVPYCIEPSLGVDRLVLVTLCDSYFTETVGADDIRIVMKLHPAIAPYKAAILPLQKKLSDEAIKLYDDLSQYFMLTYDETGSIGKRYRRQDEIGTPLCITFDFESSVDKQVTIRERDTMKQTRVAINELKNYIENFIKY